MSTIRRRLQVVAALACGLPAACASAPTRSFVLEPTPASAPVAATAGVRPVRIDSVHLPAWLDRPELVRQVGAEELRIDDFARWGAPLAQLARRTLTQDLVARLPQGAVVFPDSPSPDGAVGVVVDVLALSREADRVVMDVSWTAVPPPAPRGSGPTAPPMSAVPHPLHLSAPAAPAEAPGAPAADLSALLAKLADAIAADAIAAPPR